ncbi:MAG: hypothetical protein WCF57_04365 [Pyrinomonadaceae bacterium]
MSLEPLPPSLPPERLPEQSRSYSRQRWDYALEQTRGQTVGLISGGIGAVVAAVIIGSLLGGIAAGVAAAFVTFIVTLIVIFGVYYARAPKALYQSQEREIARLQTKLEKELAEKSKFTGYFQGMLMEDLLSFYPRTPKQEEMEDGMIVMETQTQRTIGSIVTVSIYLIKEGQEKVKIRNFKLLLTSGEKTYEAGYPEEGDIYQAYVGTKGAWMIADTPAFNLCTCLDSKLWESGDSQEGFLRFAFRGVESKDLQDALPLLMVIDGRGEEHELYEFKNPPRPSGEILIPRRFDEE